MEDTYKTPLAKWARILEIFIPGYMFGKAWGIANHETVDLFRALFPPFLIDGAEWVKSLMHTDSQNVQFLVSTSAGAVIGFIVILVLAVFMHLVLRDRRYIDSVRFTSISLIPLAVMNGTLSHVVKTLLEGLNQSHTVEQLTNTALKQPQGTMRLMIFFYLVAVWMISRRTGVTGKRRYGVLLVAIGFLVVYFACGLSITQAEWEVLLPKLQATFQAH